MCEREGGRERRVTLRGRERGEREGVLYVIDSDILLITGLLLGDGSCLERLSLTVCQRGGTAHLSN